MEIRPMSEAEAREEIAKAGGYSVYREQTLKPELPKPQFVQKSAAELTVERLEYFAKAENLTLEQYVARHPEMYTEYQRLLG
jgi:hypothetical protein